MGRKLAHSGRQRGGRFSPRYKTEGSGPFHVHRPGSRKQKQDKKTWESNRLVYLSGKGGVFSKAQSKPLQDQRWHFYQFLFSLVRQIKLQTVFKNYLLTRGSKITSVQGQMDAWQHNAIGNEEEIEKLMICEKLPFPWGYQPWSRNINHIHQSGDIFRNREETYKSAGVIVPDGLGVPEGLQERVGLQDNVLDVLSWKTCQRSGRYKHQPGNNKPHFP